MIYWKPNDTNNQEIETQFIQIIQNDIYEVKELYINPLYTKLAKASGTNVIGLRPNELISINGNTITITPTYPPELKYIEMLNGSISEREEIIQSEKLMIESLTRSNYSLNKEEIRFKEENIKRLEKQITEMLGRIKMMKEAINKSMIPRIMQMNGS